MNEHEQGCRDSVIYVLNGEEARYDCVRAVGHDGWHGTSSGFVWPHLDLARAS